MATANKTKGQKEELITALYCRLSVDDDNKDMESNSITNQKQILQDFARREGYRNTQFFIDMYNRILIQCPPHRSVEKWLKQRLSADLNYLPKAFFFVS